MEFGELRLRLDLRQRYWFLQRGLVRDIHHCQAIVLFDPAVTACLPVRVGLTLMKCQKQA